MRSSIRLPVPAFRVVTVLLMGVLVGCGGGPITPKPDNTSEYPRVALNDAALRDAVRMNEARVNRTEQDLLHVVQPVRVAADREMLIEYRFVFFDAAGRVLRPEMSWRYKRLEKKVPDVLSATSTSPEADDYRLLMRWARD